MPLLAPVDDQMEAEIEAQIQQISNIPYLLQEGGVPFLAMGLILGFVGLIFVIKPQRPSTVAIYAFVSLLPGIIAMIGVYVSCSEFVEMGTSPDVPKPDKLFGVIGRAMGRSFYGLLATLIPMFFSTIAFLRTRPAIPDQSSLPQSDLATGS